MSKEVSDNNNNPHYSVHSEGSVLQLELSGDWIRDEQFPDKMDNDLQTILCARSEIHSVQVNMQKVTAWNSALLTSIVSLNELCQKHDVDIDTRQMPEEMIRLLKLAMDVDARDSRKYQEQKSTFLYTVGNNAINAVKEVGDVMVFLRDVSIAFFNLLRGKSVYRSADTWLIMQQTGAEALPIVSLLNFLVGAILGYIGAMQLEKFGAEIFIGDMVGVSMTREIAAIITAIIMAGRSGAAFAAQLGTMKVNEEIDALKSMGLSPIEFLVLPRMIGMMLMMPLLAVYAVFMGVFGGALVAYAVLNITLEQYLEVVIKSVSLNDLVVGIIMSVVFGSIVAVIGCQKGISCGKTAEAVGASTTSAVVTATVIIFVSAALLTVLFGVMGI